MPQMTGMFGLIRLFLWCFVAELSSSPDPSSGVVSSRVWVRIPVMTLVPLSKALNHNCFVKSWEGIAFCSTSQAPSGWYLCLHPYRLWRGNPVSAPWVRSQFNDDEFVYFFSRGIDVVRNKIKTFAQKKVTLPKGRHKVIILDEADR